MKIILLLALAAAGVYGQGMPMLPFQPTYNELKDALGLTDDQVAQLKQIQQKKTQDSQAVFQQIGQKQRELNDLLNSAKPDPMAIGTLNIEMQKLRAQATAPVSSKDAAMAVLKPEQKAKLAKLEEVLKLRQAADQAVSLNLLEYPRQSMPVAPPVVFTPGQSK